jgi:putative ABC transport system permease protein
LLGEQAVLTVAAVPPGCAIGWLTCAWIVDVYQWELFRLPLAVSVHSYAFASLVVALAATASGLLVGRRIARFDLVAVLKTRE